MITSSKQRGSVLAGGVGCWLVELDVGWWSWMVNPFSLYCSCGNPGMFFSVRNQFPSDSIQVMAGILGV